ncbi:hypothetical protein Hypma_003990 [Hypsizygus marmoreus]|uniref:Uncharacterized protein n=1 Tax=Hypsizygus marmoreus TaxID=39966 RepID=A0A369J2N5_HYPMA|nr:hypothetical protein Hypma_003990 [Hypsizygus marmoreus]
MTKPTVLQSLLGRPSQTYSFPQEKVYYSTKQNMLRIATESNGQELSQTFVVGDDAEPKLNSVKPTNDVTIIPDGEQLSITDVDDGDGDGEDTDSDRDIFYTPNTSPRVSMASSTVGPLRSPSPPPPSPPPVPSTKTSFTHTNTSTTSVSSTSLEAHSLFSMASSDSSRMTTPVQSDSGQRTVHRKTNHPPPPRVDQEWAKDVRWLVPPNTKSTTTPRRHTSKVEPQTRTKPNASISKSISKATPSIMSSMAALLEEDELQDSSNAYPSTHQPRSNVIISPPRRSGPRTRMASNPAPSLTSVPSSSSSTKLPSTLHRRRSRSLGHTSAPASHASTSASASSHSSSSSSHKTSKYASSSADAYDPTSSSLPTFTPGDLPSQGTPGYTSLVLPRAPIPLSQTSHRPKGIFNISSSGTIADVGGKVDLTRGGIAQTTMASVEVVRGLSGGSSLGSNTSPRKKLLGLFRRGSTSVSPSPSGSASGPQSAFGARQIRPRSQSEDGVAHSHTLDIVRGSDSPLGFTSYRTPPKYVPSGSVLVQVWAVGVDSVDVRLVFGGGSASMRSNTHDPHTPIKGTTTTSLPTTPKRSLSLRSTLGRFGSASPGSSPTSQSQSAFSSSTPMPGNLHTPPAGVGYIPGRSFVGRILECGWEVEDEAKRGDWVVGLLDLKKCGALTEFIVVDRHRIHRAPYPRMDEVAHSPFSLKLHNTQPEVHFKPQETPSHTPSNTTSSPSRSSSSRSTSKPSPGPSRNNSLKTNTAPHLPHLGTNNIANSSRSHALPPTLEELALLPICGIPAYRAVRTFAFAFSNLTDDHRGTSMPSPLESGWDMGSIDGISPVSKGKGKARDVVIPMPASRVDHGVRSGGRRRRVLVLRGHDGPGAMAVQMLVHRGWRVCVHVPYAALAYEEGGGLAEDDSGGGGGGDGERVDGERKDEYRMRRVEERIRAWGGEEVIFDDGEDGGGEDDRGAVVRVIESLCADGDVFDAVLDTVGGKEVWEASERLLKSLGVVDGVVGNGGKKIEKGKRAGIGVKQFTTLVGDTPGRAIPSAGDNFRAGLRSLHFGVGGTGDGKKVEGGKVGYAWVNAAQDVDWEGQDVSETLNAVLRTVMEDGVRPWVGENGDEEAVRMKKVIPFEETPGVFVKGSKGVLADGGTVVVKIVG